MVSKVDIIVSAIIQGDFSLDELRVINNVLRVAHRNKSVIATRNFEAGETVQFTGKSGRIYTGKVKKVNIKNIVVTDSPTVSYKVPAAMLRAV